MDENKVVNINNKDLNDIDTEIQAMSEDYTSLSNSIIASYTSDLDSLIQSIYFNIRKDNYSDQDLEKQALDLSATLYFVSVRIEEAGVLEDLSKMLKQEQYNKSYLDTQLKAVKDNIKISVAQTQALAEEKSKHHTMMNAIYSHVVKAVKGKIDSAYELLSTMKKIISKRMSDAQLSSNINVYTDKKSTSRRLLEDQE